MDPIQSFMQFCIHSTGKLFLRITICITDTGKVEKITARPVESGILFLVQKERDWNVEICNWVMRHDCAIDEMYSMHI